MYFLTSANDCKCNYCITFNTYIKHIFRINNTFSQLQIIPPANMGRKFSAPGYLCPTLPTPSNAASTSTTTTHLPNPANPLVPLGPRQGSLGPVAQGFGYTSVPYSAPQWAGPTGTCQVSMLNPAQPLSQYQPPTTASVSLHQGYQMGGAPAPQRSVGQGGSEMER